MNKSVRKKLDDNVVKSLTTVCDLSKHDIQGFEWLSHTADFSNFPSSLEITCVFATQVDMQSAKDNGDDRKLIARIQQALLKTGILLKQAKRNVRFDSEENGAAARLL